MAKWVIARENNDQEQGLLGVPASVLNILTNRGIPASDLEDFLSPAPKVTYDPFLLTDLKEAAELLIGAADSGRTICVYGDYDADGITSTALMTSVLTCLTDKVFSYVPSRFSDGYGLSVGAVDKIRQQGADVLITVDCGSTSPAEVAHARELGMDVIVTDHHILREGMDPDCLFVNPKRDGNYPFSELCGCGVAFKLAQGMQRILEQRGDSRFTKAKLNSLLDLVAISTVADIVPLRGENRNLVKYGLDRINRKERAGLTSLLNALDLSGRIIDSSSISYIIAPNLNALGRMGSAGPGVELLESRSSAERLDELAELTIKTNIERKAEQEKTFRICRQRLAEGNCGDYAPVILAEGAHEGVAGIVAGNLKEQLYRPVCIVTPTGDGMLKGTGRSIPGVNLHQCLENCGDIFTRFGGHAGACGFSLKEENLGIFRERMQEQVRALADKDPELFTETIYIEHELTSAEKNIGYAEKLQLLEPYGEANPVPLFCIRNAQVGSVRTMGADGQHIRFTASTDDRIPVGCVLFGRAEQYKDMIFGRGRIDVAGELDINEFRGERRLQMRVKDIRESGQEGNNVY